jgi:hypothetical protein
LFQRIGDRLFLVHDRFEHGLMVGASFPNKSIASVLSFVPFTAQQANNALVGSCLTSIACLIRLMLDGDRNAKIIKWV